MDFDDLDLLDAESARPLASKPGEYGQIYGMGIRDGRGYGPYGAGYTKDGRPYGPNGEILSADYDLRKGGRNQHGSGIAWLPPKRVLPGFDAAPVRLGEDSWLTIHTPGDYVNAVTQLKASADNLDLTAQGEPGWKVIYDNAQRLYGTYHDVGLLSAINPFGKATMDNSSWNAIADSQRRVDEFAAQMRSQKKAVVEPPHTPIDDSVLPKAETFAKYIPWIIGGVVVLVTVPVVLPPLVSLLAARKMLVR